MKRFNLGDEVVITESRKVGTNNIEGLGMEGTVVDLSHSRVGPGYIGVSFKGLTSGHSCDHTVTDDSGWYVFSHQLALISISLENE